MPAWLGAALAGVFAVVTGYRARCRDLPAALMAAGMATMALGMGGIGPHLVHGPWWALGFAAVALWSALWSMLSTRADATHGRLSYLVGGVAMAYMCVPRAMVGTAALARLDGGHQHGVAAVATPAPDGPALAGWALEVSPRAELFALFGWLLACYFLLATVTALTRRDADGGWRRCRHTTAEAAMGVGTAVMLVASA